MSKVQLPVIELVTLPFLYGHELHREKRVVFGGCLSRKLSFPQQHRELCVMFMFLLWVEYLS